MLLNRLFISDSVQTCRKLMLIEDTFGCLVVNAVSPATWLKSSPALIMFLCCASSTGTMANLEQWVNDRLHDILGLSDRYVSQFMIGTARKASSPQDFVARLEQTGTIDIEPSVVAFAQELYDKVFSTVSPSVDLA